MNVHLTRKAEKSLKKLDPKIKKKLIKQLLLLEKDFNHPSLYTKKTQDQTLWEARIDFHYRFTFKMDEDNIYIIAIGPHDEGLGKK